MPIDYATDIQIRWMARKLGLTLERARLLAGIAFYTREAPYAR